MNYLSQLLRQSSPRRLVHRPNALNSDIDDAEKYGAGADRNQEEGRAQPRNNRQKRENEIDEKNSRAHLRMRPARLHHSLICVTMMRMIPFLTVHDSPAKRDRRIEYESAEEQHPDEERHRARIKAAVAERSPVAGALGMGALTAFASTYHSLGVASYTRVGDKTVSYGAFGMVFVNP